MNPERTYYLAKTEPSTYSIDDLARAGTDVWDGVRNPRAVAALKAMRPGDRVLIYHSGEKTIVGLAEVAGPGRPDPKDPRSWLVNFRFVRKFAAPFVTLADVKGTGAFEGFALVRQGRLSVMPVPVAFVRWLRGHGLKL